jgi:molecular chaperone DnaK (HSP70)
MSRYYLGLDLGTTYTAAAVWRDGRVEIGGTPDPDGGVQGIYEQDFGATVATTTAVP